MEGLLTRDPRDRLGGVRGIEEVKSHKFFKGVDFDAVLERKTAGIFAYEETVGPKTPMKTSEYC